MARRPTHVSAHLREDLVRQALLLVGRYTSALALPAGGEPGQSSHEALESLLVGGSALEHVGGEVDARRVELERRRHLLEVDGEELKEVGRARRDAQEVGVALRHHDGCGRRCEHTRHECGLYAAQGS